MKIIILGMDNTGKTTLSNKLKEISNFKLLNSPGKDKTKKELEDFMVNNLKSSENIIFERFSFFEEMIYGKILRGESKFNFKDDVWNLLVKQKPIIIYCRPCIQTIKNFGDREQMDGVIEKSNKLLSSFDYLIEKINDYLDVYYYDYETQNPEEIWRNINGIRI